ncbi:4Fe-4S binding protein [Haloimpatiens lingqiaonensis]|uniref:4Fe-4S binding protein n=1 Tax=Haloimpatiens lingqiaonensis TaxID=1380675 RepID=UPI0010FE839E|nr:4Fe-4S binding protein [Haloimpatiens lingqiaonensis]
MGNITAEEKKKLKGQGFLPQRQDGYFACRVITKNGCNTAKEMKRISEIAEKYGRGYVSYTTRLTVEIPWIEYENIEKVKDELKELGLYSGGTGDKIRPVTACKGTVCVYGLVDTQALAEEIHNTFYEGWRDVSLPHKFKIGIGGCPNNCIKPDLNDFGIVGQRKVKIEEDKCKACNNCGMEKVCVHGAINKEEGQKAVIDRDKCVNCGKCSDACYFGAAEVEKEGFKIYLGGKWGKKTRPGQAIQGIFSKDEVMSILEKSILFYKENGNKKERFGDMIDRIGKSKVEEALGFKLL